MSPSAILAATGDPRPRPSPPRALGREVKAEGLAPPADEQIVAICSHGRTRQRIPILDLPLPDPPPPGAEWIAAYRRWAEGAK